MIEYTALPTETVRALQDGQPDAYGNTPERSISGGDGTPCRHCLRHIDKGKDMLILAFCPFDNLQPYAETGPIFLCANRCARGGGQDLPEILTTAPGYLIKGYSANERIVYGTGMIVAPARMTAQATAICKDLRVAYIHVRSARNNCYQARIDRG